MPKADITGHYVTVNGARTYFETCGAGTPVLLMHTAGRDNRQWHGIMQELAPDFRLFAPDYPGHGKSWPRPGNTCLDDLTDIARWLHAFMAEVAGAPFAVMGCSVGGNLSLLMPALFDNVVASVVLQGADHTPSISEDALDLLTHPQINITHSAMDMTMSLMGSRSPEEALAFARWGVLSLIPLAQQGDLRAYVRTDIRDLMKQIRVPILLVRGKDDWIVPQHIVDATRSRIVNAPRCEMTVLDGIGHFPHVENPARIAQVARDFLASCGLNKKTSKS